MKFQEALAEYFSLYNLLEHFDGTYLYIPKTEHGQC